MRFRSSTQPLCRCCGKPIPKHTTVEFFKAEDGLRSKADAQRRFNQQVISVGYDTTILKRHNLAEVEAGERYVWRVSLWDGETYEDEFFCKGPCRDRLAYAAARKGACLHAYNDAVSARRRKAS